MIVKMTILRLLGSSDDKEKIGVARPEGPPLRGFIGYVLIFLLNLGVPSSLLSKTFKLVHAS